MNTFRKSYAALATIPVIAALTAAAPATANQAATCPIPVVNMSVTPDTTSAQVDTTVTCTLAGLPLFSFPIVLTVSGLNCAITTVTFGQGSTPISIKLVASFTCKPDDTGKSGATVLVSLLDPNGTELNSMKLNNSNTDKQATTAKTTTIVEVRVGPSPLPERGAGFSDDGGSSTAQSDHEVY